MAFQSINVGTVANDGTGDPLRTAFSKVNGNFTDAQTQINTLTTDVAAKAPTDHTHTAKVLLDALNTTPPQTELQTLVKRIFEELATVLNLQLGQFIIYDPNPVNTLGLPFDAVPMSELDPATVLQIRTAAENLAIFLTPHLVAESLHYVKSTAVSGTKAINPSLGTNQIWELSGATTIGAVTPHIEGVSGVLEISNAGAHTCSIQTGANVRIMDAPITIGTGITEVIWTCREDGLTVFRRGGSA